MNKLIEILVVGVAIGFVIGSMGMISMTLLVG